MCALFKTEYTVEYVYKPDRRSVLTEKRYEGVFDEHVLAKKYAKSQSRVLKNIPYRVVVLTPAIREIMESPQFRSITP